MSGRTINLQQLQGDLLGGTVTGNAMVDLDHLFGSSKIDLAWKDLQSERVVRLYPGLKGMGGNFSGTATLHPATAPRPLEPLALDVYTHPDKGHWKTVNFGGIEFHAYLGEHRLIASDLQPSTIHLGKGGSIDLWFSSSDHIDTVPLPNGQERPTGVTVSNQFTLTLRALEIDPFVNAFDPTHQAGFGRIRGKVHILSAPKTRPMTVAAPPTTGPTTGPSRANQALAQRQEDSLKYLLQSTILDGDLYIGDTDLGNFGPIAFLYNLMHLGKNIRKPTGYGTIALHMERGNLHISNLDYFNRGIEVTGVALISEIWKLEKAPIEGSAVGSLSPLKDIKLPVFAEVGALLTQSQRGLTAVIFKGTVAHPGSVYLKQLGLSELGSELRGILLNEFGSGRK
jgi:hypothetical protein